MTRWPRWVSRESFADDSMTRYPVNDRRSLRHHLYHYPSELLPRDRPVARVGLSVVSPAHHTPDRPHRDHPGNGIARTRLSHPHRPEPDGGMRRIHGLIQNTKLGWKRRNEGPKTDCRERGPGDGPCLILKERYNSHYGHGENPISQLSCCPVHRPGRCTWMSRKRWTWTKREIQS